MHQLGMPTAAGNGFGGTHVAFTDNVFSLLVNPAAMIRTRQKSFFTLAPSLFSPQTVSDMAKPISGLAQGSTSALGEMANLLGAQKGQIALGFELREFPFSFAWVANGFGFGLWNRVYINANIIGLNLKADVYADVMLPIGFAFKFMQLGNHTVDAGFAIKPFVRAMASGTEKILSLMDDDNEFIDNLEIPLIVGGGLDIGLMYRWGNWFRVGFTFNDVFSHGQVARDLNGFERSKDTYYIPFTMTAGLAFDFRLGRIVGLTLAADWRDIANVFNQDDYLNHRNAALDFGIGAELSLFNIIYARLGMSEMLPSVGMGLHFGGFKIDLAYYGRELGMEPGQLSVAILDLSISVRPQAKARDWPWARRALIGDNKERKWNNS